MTPIITAVEKFAHDLNTIAGPDKLDLMKEAGAFPYYDSDLSRMLDTSNSGDLFAFSDGVDWWPVVLYSPRLARWIVDPTY